MENLISLKIKDFEDYYRIEKFIASGS